MNKIMSYIFAALMGIATLAMLLVGVIRGTAKATKAEAKAADAEAEAATLERINEATANSPDADGAVERMRQRRDKRGSDL